MYKNPHYVFVAALVIALAGFFPSYFARLDDAPLRHHIHGIVSTSWILLLITQGWLMANGKIAQHRTLGRLSPVLAVAVFLTSIWIVRFAIPRDLDRNPELFSKIYVMDWTLVLFFAAIFVLAIVNRKNVHIHQRCMVLTLLPLVPPAFGRAIFFYILYPLGQPFSAIWHPMVLGMLAFLAYGMYDDRRRGRSDWPYPAGFGLMLIIYVAGFYAQRSESVHAFLRWTAT